MNDFSHLFSNEFNMLIKPVSKWSYKTTGNNVVQTEDRMFLMSIKEFGFASDSPSWINNWGATADTRETTGTGINHDEAYIFYQQDKDVSVCTTTNEYCQTRSIREKNGYDHFCIYGKRNIYCSMNASTPQAHWIPAFCI